MSWPEQTVTMQVKPCGVCGGGLLEKDRFCRWCGEQQVALINETSIDLGCSREVAVSTSASVPRYETSVLECHDANRGLYHRVSGPLVNAVVAGASRNSAGELRSAFIRRAILALISVPIWLIIVLLSPLDAYAAARNVVRGM